MSQNSPEQVLAEAARVRATIQAALERLVGLPLSIARRAGSMGVFHFGEVRPVPRGTVGEFALHVSCPWRLEHLRGPVTGSDDLFRPADPESTGPEWDWEEGETFQDRRLSRVLRGYDPDTRSHVNTDPARLVVKQVEVGDYGEAVLALKGGFRLVLFPAGVASEAWRMFRPGEDPHFVVEGDGRAGDEG